MGQVRITLPHGVSVDPTRLTSAVRFALQGGFADEKVWRQNDVPAIAQLEEAAYDEGMQDLAELYEAVVTGLDLPPDQQAQAVLQKALRRDTPPIEEPALSAADQPRLPSVLTPETAAEILADLKKSLVLPAAD
jgi:hypothetical protein